MFCATVTAVVRYLSSEQLCNYCYICKNVASIATFVEQFQQLNEYLCINVTTDAQKLRNSCTKVVKQLHNSGNVVLKHFQNRCAAAAQKLCNMAVQVLHNSCAKCCTNNNSAASSKTIWPKKEVLAKSNMVQKKACASVKQQL